MKKLNLLTVLKYCAVSAFVLSSFSLLNAQSLEQGLKQLDLDKYVDARNTFQSLINKDSKDATARYYLGKLDVIEKKYDEAQAEFNKGREADDDNYLNTVGLGLVQLVKGDTAGAAKTFETAMDETNYKNVDVLMNVADAYILSDAKNFDRAIDALEKANKAAKGKNPAVFAKLGDIYYRLSNGSQAIQNYRTAIDKDKNVIRPYVGIAQIYMKIKNYEDALYNLDKALKLDSTYAPAYEALANYYYTIRKTDKDAINKAVENFKKFIQYSENTVEKQVRFTTFLYLAEQYKEAINQIKTLQSNGKNSPELQHILAYSYYSLDDAQNGIPALQTYISMAKPNEVTSTDYEFLGKLFEKAGNDSLATENLQKAVSMDSTRSDIHSELASIFYKDKNWAGAAKEYVLKEKTSGKSLPAGDLFQLGQAYNKIAASYGKTDTVAAAEYYAKMDTAYAKFIEVQPALWQGYYWRAIANANLDPETEKGLAKPYYEKFVEIATKDPAQADKFKSMLVQAYSYLGYYYYLQKDNAASRTYWQKVVELEPDNSQAKTALKEIK